MPNACNINNFSNFDFSRHEPIKLAGAKFIAS